MKPFATLCLIALLLAPFTALRAADAPKPTRPNNLALDPAHASIRKELATQLDAWQSDSPPVPVMTGVAPEPKPGTPVVEKPQKKERQPKQRKK